MMESLPLLNISWNQLTSLPIELKKSPSLGWLKINHNAFKEFPEVLYQMPQLEKLYIGNNPIKRIEDRISNLYQLSWLRLYETKLADKRGELRILLLHCRFDHQ